MSFSPKEIALWQEMADLTFSKCKETCHNLGSCCEGAYCDMAQEAMEKQGMKVPPMPFVKDGKCVIPPHCRQLCSIHQCKISSLGFDPKDPGWTQRYFELREQLAEIEYDRATDP